LDSNGRYSASVTYPSAGQHSVVAHYVPPASGNYAASDSPPVSFIISPAVACGGFGIPIGTTSAADLCDTWPAGSPPAGISAGSAGNWTLHLTGTITLPSSGEWIFCVADTQNFVMNIDGQLVLTNEIYEQDGDNGDINFQFLGTYAGTMPTVCEAAQLTSGQHQIELDITGNTGKTTSFNIAYQPPAAKRQPSASQRPRLPGPLNLRGATPRARKTSATCGKPYRKLIGSTRPLPTERK
jgi:hypothetical protein